MSTFSSQLKSLVPLHLTQEEYSSVEQVLWDLHFHDVLAHQCSSLVVQRINAPASLVWSLVRRFDKPESYKHFIRSCHMQVGDGCKVGSIREVSVVTGLPAVCSRERLELLDDEKRVLSFSVVGGEHRLRNYKSTTSLHEIASSSSEHKQFLTFPNEEDSHGEAQKIKPSSCSALVVESYVVDVPEGNSHEDTVIFVDTVIKCNLQSLAHVSERLALAAHGQALQ